MDFNLLLLRFRTWFEKKMVCLVSILFDFKWRQLKSDGGGGDDMGRNGAHIQHPPIKALVPPPLRGEGRKYCQKQHIVSELHIDLK